MPTPKDGQVIFPPDESNAPLWRYMDFTKFVSMLESNALYFARADHLGDAFEGSYSNMNVKLRPEAYAHAFKDRKEGVPKGFEKTIHKMRAWMPTRVFINCWHLNKHESAAMWKLYGATGGAIAITTTYSKLREALPKECDIGVVKYVDYNTEVIPEYNILGAFVHKRKSFEHEREVRAIIADWDNAIKGDEIKIGTPNEEHGKQMSVDLKKLIDVIYVSPGAPEYFRNSVVGVANRYGLRK